MVLASLFVAQRACAIDHLRYDVVDPVVVSQHAHLLVQAWSKSESQSTNVRHYFVSVDLNPTGQSKVTVVGPLLQDGATRLEGQEPLEFDRELFGAVPTRRIHFSPDGELVKDVLENASQSRRWLLQLRGDSACWKDDGLRDRLHLYAPQQTKDRFFGSNSGRYIVERVKDINVGVYDIETSRRLEDKWLEGVATDLFQRADLRYPQIVLTDDLKFVVAFPRATSENDEFAFDKKSYLNASNGLVYERDVRDPRVFSGMRHEDPGNTPFNCYSDNGDLRFFAYTDTSLSLRDINDHVVASHNFTAPKEWLNEVGVKVTHDAKNKSLTMTLVPTMRLHPDDEKVSDTLHILIWRYQESQIASYAVSTNPWFKETDEGFCPVNGIPIERP